MNKKGYLMRIISLGFLLMVLGSILSWHIFQKPKVKTECENYPEYSLDICLSHLKEIKSCSSIGAKYISTKRNLFSSDIILCLKNDEVIRI